MGEIWLKLINLNSFANFSMSEGSWITRDINKLCFYVMKNASNEVSSDT